MHLSELYKKIILFSLLAVILLMSGGFVHLSKGKLEEKIIVKKSSKEKNSESSDEFTIQELSIQAVVPVFQIDLQQALYFIFEIILPEVTQTHLPESKPFFIDTYLENVFEYFIVVNAP